MGQPINNSTIMDTLLRLLKRKRNKDGNQDGILQLLCDIYLCGYFYAAVDEDFC